MPAKQTEIKPGDPDAVTEKDSTDTDSAAAGESSEVSDPVPAGLDVIHYVPYVETGMPTDVCSSSCRDAVLLRPELGTLLQVAPSAIVTGAEHSPIRNARTWHVPGEVIPLA